jgi:putative membrane protein
MTRHFVLFGLMALAACATDTRSEERPTEQARLPEQQGRTPENLEMDQQFIQQAASGGMFEVESARLALSRQAPAETTELAQHLIRDHSQANDKLRQIAEEKAVEVPQEMMPQHQQQLEQLSTAQGEQFASMFQQVQAQAHRDTIALFERCARYCQDMQIREFASSQLPTLRQHMEHIQEMQATARRPDVQQGEPINPRPQGEPMEPTEEETPPEETMPEEDTNPLDTDPTGTERETGEPM